MISDTEMLNIIRAEIKESVGYSGENSALHENRAFLMDSYNCEPYGDEVEGKSKVVTADVFEVVEGQLPTLIKLFTQGDKIAKFTPSRPEYEAEAEQKELLCDWVFSQQHDATKLIHSQLKDGLLQYTGILEVYWDDSEEIQDELEFTGQTQEDLIALQLRDDIEITEVEEIEEGFKIEARTMRKSCPVRIEPVPPNEFLISKRARCLKNPPLIGKQTPKTRSDLIRMGFDKDQVLALGQEEGQSDSVKVARTRDLGGDIDTNPTEDRSKDIINLVTAYVRMDADEDGIEELWLVHYADCDQGEILSKGKVSCHPYSVFIEIPMPGRVIGTCSAAQVADYQYWKTTLVRHMNDNIYACNYPRLLVNDAVNMDDALTLRHGGLIRTKGQAAVGNSASPLVIPSQIEEILAAIEHIDTMIERRTGVTRYNQGLDTDSLNKTATGFKGIAQLSQLRMELKARLYASGALKDVFDKIVRLFQMHAKEDIEIPVTGNVMRMSPMSWKDKIDCEIQLGRGVGEQQQHIQNLAALLEQQKAEREVGSPVVDAKKIYNTFEDLTRSLGLGDVSQYFNDPEIPEQLLMAEIEKLTRENMALQQQSQNMLAEAEQIKQQATTEREILKIQTKAQFDLLKSQQEQTQHDDKMAMELTKITSDIAQTEAKTGRDIDEDEVLYIYDQATGRINRAV